MAIEAYWAALEAWRAADRRVKRLRKKLPEELIRQPRVQISWLLRGRDNTGADIREPIYAHSEWEIKDRARSDCKTMLAIHAPLHSWFVDPTAKGSIRRGPNKRAKKQRPVIRAKYKAWEKEKCAALLLDKTRLYERQREAGWRQAVEAEEAARGLVIKLRYQLQGVEPATVAGAISLIETIYTAHRSEMNSSSDRAPYGLGKYYTARIARHVVDFLKAQRVQDHGRKAA
jgi:hypothetical protein